MTISLHLLAFEEDDLQLLADALILHDELTGKQNDNLTKDERKRLRKMVKMVYDKIQHLQKARA